MESNLELLQEGIISELHLCINKRNLVSVCEERSRSHVRGALYDPSDVKGVLSSCPMKIFKPAKTMFLECIHFRDPSIGATGNVELCRKNVHDVQFCRKNIHDVAIRLLEEEVHCLSSRSY